MQTALPRTEPLVLSLSDRTALAVATGFGAGLAPKAPGTFGTLVAVPFFWALARLDPWMQLLSIAAFCGLAVWAAGRAGAVFGESDDQRIVSDEIAGYLVSVALLPATPKVLIAGFVLFRLFDILKPWPACWFDRKLHTGLGNVMDDLCAGVYARLGVGLMLWLWP